MSGHRAAEIAGHHDGGEDRRLRDKVEHDQGAMWPIAFALPKLTAADEARIAALVKKAMS